MSISERREREKEQRRESILKAAQHLFATKGAEGASMEEISELAEFSKGTLYLYFKNKEELHFEVLWLSMIQLNKIMQEHYKPEYNGAENLLRMGEAYIAFSREEELFYNLIMQFDSKQIERLQSEQKQRILSEASPMAFLMQIVKKGQNDGSVRDDIATRELSLLLWANLTGVLQLIFYRPKMLNIFSISEEDMIRNEFDILINGIIHDKKK
ncbi:MAG: helix-turn-helix domain-containing protein [Bacteroidales bacterium]|nr:helix-turn-helix domain-containing protein [Bacteroidales bacterium]